jgi:hypothetical protein
MSECCENNCCAMTNKHRGGCDFDLDMILWVLIIIVIVTCMCD